MKSDDDVFVNVHNLHRALLVLNEATPSFIAGKMMREAVSISMKLID